MNQRRIEKAIDYFAGVIRRGHRDVDVMENFQTLALAAYFLGGFLLRFDLLIFFARSAPNALDLRKITIEQRNHERKRQSQIDARVDLPGGIENHITVDERRQYGNDKQTPHIITDAAEYQRKQTRDVEIRARRPARAQNNDKDRGVE